jgi:Fe-S cluster assembly iron-binding protein IscA
VLALTHDATDAIEGILAAADEPEHAGIRIAASVPATDSRGSTGLQVALAEVPADGDEVIEEAGARVFVEETVAPLLEDKTLDADSDGEQVRFSLSNQT